VELKGAGTGTERSWNWNWEELELELKGAGTGTERSRPALLAPSKTVSASPRGCPDARSWCFEGIRFCYAQPAHSDCAITVAPGPLRALTAPGLFASP
jgi:hypothetical protein